MCTRELDPPFWQRNDDFSKLIAHSFTDIKLSDKTKRDSIHVGKCESASKITKKTEKKFHGKVEITYQIRTPCCMSHDPRFHLFFFFPPFFYWFFFMLSTFEFVLFFFFFWELKRLSIGFATCLSIHDYRLNIVWNPIWFSLSLSKFLCPQEKKKKNLIRSIEVQSIVIFNYNVCRWYNYSILFLSIKK